MKLPDFTILTGLNGSGKSHLLQAIEAGFVKTTASPDQRKHISLFDWNTIVPKDTGSYSLSARMAKIEEIVQRFKTVREQMIGNLQAWLKGNNFDADLISDFNDLEVISDPVKRSSLPTQAARNTAIQVESWARKQGQNFLNNIRNEESAFQKVVEDSWKNDYRELLFGDEAVHRKVLYSMSILPFVTHFIIDNYPPK